MKRSSLERIGGAMFKSIEIEEQSRKMGGSILSTPSVSVHETGNHPDVLTDDIGGK